MKMELISLAFLVMVKRIVSTSKFEWRIEIINKQHVE